MITTPKQNKKGTGKLMDTKSKVVENPTEALISCLLPAITRLHWFHLNTSDYITHEVLGALYVDLQGQLDCLAEQYIDCYGPLKDYEGHEYYKDHTALLYSLKEKVEACNCSKRGINATIDVIHTTLLKACYKLKLQ